MEQRQLGRHNYDHNSCYQRSFIPWKHWSGINLPTHLHLDPRVGMCGATSTIVQNLFMAWFLVTRTNNINFSSSWHLAYSLWIRFVICKKIYKYAMKFISYKTVRKSFVTLVYLFLSVIVHWIIEKCKM